MRVRSDSRRAPGTLEDASVTDPAGLGDDRLHEPSDEADGPRGWRQRVGDRRTAAVERLTPWPQANRLGTRALLFLLIVGVLAGPAALLRSYATSASATKVESPVDTGAAVAAGQARVRTQAEGAASSLVWAWLSAGQADADALDALLVYPPDQLNLPQDRPSPPSAVTVLDAAESGSSWTVTVGARGGQAGSGATYRVAVRVDDQGATTLTLPGQIPLWRSAVADRSREDGPDRVSLSANDPAAAAAGGFVQTLLSGTGDLSRWTRPGSDLTAIRPATCSTAQTTTTAAADPPEPTDGQTTDVMTTATCRRTTGRTATDRTLQYLLTLTGRGGRWEVSAYTDTPPAVTGQLSGTSPTDSNSPAVPSPGAATDNSTSSPAPNSATPR